MPETRNFGQILNTETLANMETLLALFPPAELQSFYAEFSQQMLLTTTAQLERHQAMQKLLEILAEG